MLYALLDHSSYIRRVHLEAALSLWRYSEDSVRYLFGERTGDQLADDVLAALREASGAGLTRTEINSALHGHRKRTEIDRALFVLAESGLALSREEQTPGRSVQRWFAVSYPAEKAEEAEKGVAVPLSEGAYSAYSAFSAPVEVDVQSDGNGFHKAVTVGEH
jgi:molybdenum cofactor biosynthesis enzyme MoaA